MEPEKYYINLAGEFLQHEMMIEIKEYMERGRCHERVAAEELKQRWIDAFRRFVGGDRANIELTDLGAELRLRGIDLPFDEVKREVAAMQAEVQRLSPDEPATDEIKGKIRSFLAEREKPGH